MAFVVVAPRILVAAYVLWSHYRPSASDLDVLPSRLDLVWKEIKKESGCCRDAECAAARRVVTAQEGVACAPLLTTINSGARLAAPSAELGDLQKEIRARAAELANQECQSWQHQRPWEDQGVRRAN